MTVQSDRVFSLACWTVHTDRHLITWSAGNDIRCERQLEPRLMRLLCLLADAADKVLTRDELISDLWPSVVVNENSLTRAVSDLRRLLSPPDGSDTTFIETVPKRGYRLCVQPQMQTSVESAARKTDVATPVRIHTQPWPAIAASLLLMLSVAHQWYWSPAENLLAENTAQLQDRVIPATIPEADLRPMLTLSDSYSAAWPAADVISPGRFNRAYAEVVTMPDAMYALPWSDNPDMSTNPTDFGRPVAASNGDLIAYVEYQDGTSRLNIRHAFGDSDPWTAFSTNEHIYQVQWSPLDEGLLFTVGLSSQSTGRGEFIRLMLLDLQSLTLHELYRRQLPNDDQLAIQKGNGSLT